MKAINLWKTLLLSAAVLTMGGGMISCSDDDDNNDKRFEGIPTITVDPASAGVELTGGTVNVVVTSDAAWKATVSESDVTLNKTKGNGKTNVAITVPAHAERSIEVNFTATGYVNGIAIPKTATLVIAQNENGETLDGTIAAIEGAGDYTLTNCWVVANTTQSFLMTDRSNAYMYVFVGSDGTVPAVGKEIDVNGNVELRNKYLQFSKPTVTVKDATHEVTLPTPQVLDYAGFFAIPEGEFAYVTITGTLVKSGNYINISFTEGSNIGSILYPNADLNVSTFENKIVDVTGFVTGMPKGINQLVATSIEENKDVVALSLDKTALNFAATGGMSRLNYTTQNLGENSVFTKIEGDADQFVVGNPSGGVIAVTAKANSGDTKSATLTVYVASSKDATPVASQTVALTQEKPTTGNETVVTFGLAQIKAENSELPVNGYGSQAPATESTWVGWTVSGVQFKGAKVCEASATGNYANCVQIQGNATDAVKQGFFGNVTAPEGKKITKIVVESKNTAQYKPNFNLYLGDAQMPTANKMEAEGFSDAGVESGSVLLYTTTFNIAGNYNYFAVRNDTQGALYLNSITIYFE